MKKKCTFFVREKKCGKPGKNSGKPGCACAHPNYGTSSICACAHNHFRSLHPHKFGFVTTYILLTSLNNLPVKVTNNLSDTVFKPIMTYNSEVTYLDTFISLYRARKRASTNDKEVDLFNLIDKTPIANLQIYICPFANMFLASKRKLQI